MTSHTRKSDEQLLIQFVLDQGWDDLELVEAAARLQAAIKQDLQDYSIPAADHEVNNERA